MVWSNQAENDDILERCSWFSFTVIYSHCVLHAFKLYSYWDCKM